MTADQDVNNGLNGVDASGKPLDWRWAPVRARTLLGYALKKIPFTRGSAVATPSLYDAVVGTAEQVATRYIASDGNVWDFSDWLRVQIELLIAQASPADIAAARQRASVLRPWPAGFAGTPPNEVGK